MERKIGGLSLEDNTNSNGEFSCFHTAFRYSYLLTLSDEEDDGIVRGSIRKEKDTRSRSNYGKDSDRDSKSATTPDSHRSLPFMKLKKRSKTLKEGHNFKKKGVAISLNFNSTLTRPKIPHHLTPSLGCTKRT